MIKPCVKCGATDRYKSGGCRPCRREYAAKNRKQLADYNRRWHKKNRERVAVRKRKWQLANPEKSTRLEYRRQWQAANPRKVYESNRKWRAKNPEKVISHTLSRRAKKSNAGGILTAADIKSLYATNKRCLVCGSTNNLSIDHIVPIARGGRNSIDNVQILCMTCNLRKGTKTIDYRNGNIKYWRQPALMELNGPNK